MEVASSDSEPNEVASGDSEPPHRCTDRFRYVVFLLGHTCNIVSYADRTNISLAILPMRSELGFGDSAEGACLAAFFAGYACTQILGGWLTLQHGAKPVLCGAVALCSVATLLTPAAARASLTLLVCARVGLGLAEGCLLPALHALALEWSPPRERTTAAALQTSGQFVGSCVAVLCGGLASRSWPTVFYLFGAMGIGWTVLFASLAGSTPVGHMCVSAAELSVIRRGRGAEQRLASGDAQRVTSTAEAPPDSGDSSGPGAKHRRTSVPWRALLTNRACIAIYVSLASHNYSWYLLLSWLPTFLTTEQGVDLERAGALALLPYVLAALCSNLGAALVDRLMLRRWSWPVTRARKVINVAAQIGPAVALSLLAITSSSRPTLERINASGSSASAEATAADAPDPSPGPWVSALLCAASVALGAMTQAGCWANVLDVAPRHPSVLLGIANTLGTLPGILCNLITGWMLAAGWGWRPVFGIGAIMEIVGAVTYAWLASGEDQHFR